MKDTCIRKKTVKVIGYLTEEDGKLVIESYIDKDEPPVITDVNELLNDIVGLQVQILAEIEEQL